MAVPWDWEAVATLRPHLPLDAVAATARRFIVVVIVLFSLCGLVSGSVSVVGR